MHLMIFVHMPMQPCQMDISKMETLNALHGACFDIKTGSIDRASNSGPLESSL